MVVNVLLAVVAFAFALTALGSETLRPRPGRLLRRVTPRGWVAVVCLVLTLGLGVTKELNTRAREDELQRKIDAATAAIPREVAHPMYWYDETYVSKLQPLVENDLPVFVEAGDTVEFYGVEELARERNVELVAGDARYPLHAESGPLLIGGRAGERLTVAISNPNGVGISIKFKIMSTRPGGPSGEIEHGLKP